MDQSMMSGYMRRSLAMPGPSWTSTKEQMGYPDCPVSFMYYPWPLYAIVLWAPSTRIGPPIEFVLQGSMGVPLGVGGVLLWACIDWCPTGGSSLVRGSVRARALHCQSTTQQWYCIAATLLRCMVDHIGIHIYLAGHHWFGGTISY